jgi:hypothetical protein
MFGPGDSVICDYHGRQHRFARKGDIQLAVGQTLLTAVGQELAGIAGSIANEEYRLWVVSELRNNGWEITEP